MDNTSNYYLIQNFIQTKLKANKKQSKLNLYIDEGGMFGSPSIVITNKTKINSNYMDYIGNFDIHYIMKYIRNMLCTFLYTGHSMEMCLSTKIEVNYD